MTEVARARHEGAEPARLDEDGPLDDLAQLLDGTVEPLDVADVEHAVGLAREEMTEGRPLPATRALIDWFELSTKQRSFIEAAAAINLAAEGQVPGAFGPMARRLQENYGLSREAVEFWDIHEMADAEHSDVGDHIVVHHATDAATQARVRDALQHSLDAWWQFFDGIQAAI